MYYSFWTLRRLGFRVIPQASKPIMNLDEIEIGLSMQLKIWASF